ncbi:MAG: HAMP domain-containing histidine kinase [Bacteroidetes bacterium]|nr:HAMP domain-containing histidine kinase [Bacteroidota bacterium]
MLPVLLLTAVVIVILKPSPNNLRSASEEIQQRVSEIENSFNNLSQNDTLYKDLEKFNTESQALQLAENQGIAIFYYHFDSLLFWTDHHTFLPSSPGALPNGTSFLKLKNGWYVVIKHTVQKSGKVMIGAAPIKWQYPFENHFLKNAFSAPLKLTEDIELSVQKLPGSVPIYNQHSDILFYIYRLEHKDGTQINFALLLAQVMLLIIAFYYIHYFAVRIVHKKGFARGFIYLFISAGVIRAVLLILGQPSEFYHLELFQPKHYASSVFSKSLGDLFINSSILIWMVLFAAFYRSDSENRKPVSSLKAIASVVTIFLLTAGLLWIFKSLVIDSVISFEVYNILSLSPFSLLGLLSLSLLLMGHLIISKYLIHILRTSETRWGIVVGVIIFCGIAFALSAVYSSYWQAIIFTALWCTFYILAIYRLMESSSGYSVKNLLIIISLYSLLSAYLIENFYEHHERTYRKYFASKLVSERDFIAEFLFNDIYTRLEQDTFLRNYFANPITPKKEITDRLNSVYFSGYLNKYEIMAFAKNRSGLLLRNSDTTRIDYLLPSNLLGADSTDRLFYTSDSSKNFSYFSYIPYYEDTVLIGTLVIQLNPKNYYGQNVYPELLLGNNVSNLPNNRRYNYAIYHREQLVSQHGEYPYPYFWNKAFVFSGLPYQYIDVGDWEHIIYQFGSDTKVIVTEHQEGLFEPIATFSYLFTFYFLMAILVLGLFNLLNRSEVTQERFSFFYVSFRTRINYSILLITVASFVIITLVTISFLKKQYDNNYSDRLLRKEKVIHSSIEYFLRQHEQATLLLSDDNFRNTLNFEITRQAEMNDIDVNIYSPDGDLIVASQPAIYDHGLVSRKMNPHAFFLLSSEKAAQTTEEENIGSLGYLATYAPIRDLAGKTIAYLGIPYFTRSKNIYEDVSSFLVALMNAYVFLLICAALVAYFISNSITKPLTIISEKLRQLNLTKKNEPIQWNSRDEIGVLVKEYNKMISELENSAQELAKGEREIAWREMAKQIAHEIKNPLTPMKLSIQYLQRAIDSGDPNIAQLSRKVARTLEEQIENLSSIASAFSSFAKMPKTQNELINLNELLQSISDLFGREEKTFITFSTDSKSPVVFADKNQLVSVFNNLIKNALQSIPETRIGFVDIHVKEEDGWVVITVSDNGQGIPHELYEKVFVPNFTTKSSGTGLGLAITKQIIDGTGGRIWFESSENIGTTFYIRLRMKIEL